MMMYDMKISVFLCSLSENTLQLPKYRTPSLFFIVNYITTVVNDSRLRLSANPKKDTGGHRLASICGELQIGIEPT